MYKLNYNHLYYFWIIAKQGNLGRAAEQLHLSDSALSTQLKKLESQLKTDLFERKGRSLHLTEAGALTLAYADKIFALGLELCDALIDHKAQTRSIFRIGIVSSLSRNFAENFIRPLISKNEVELVIESGNQDELMGKLSRYQLDVVLTNQKSETTMSLKFQTIAKQPISIIGKPLKKNDKFNFQTDLAKYKLLLPSSGNEMRAYFDELCEQNSITYHVMAEINDMPALRLFLRDAKCIALLPKVVVQDEINNQILQEYCQVHGLYEYFYAIYTKRCLSPDLLNELLVRTDEEILNNVTN